MVCREAEHTSRRPPSRQVPVTMLPPPSPRHWQRLLTGRLADRAIDTVEQIAASLTDAIATDDVSADLGAGSAGMALFFAAWADFAGDGTARTLVHHCLQHALDSAAAHQPGPGLYGGVAGIGWTIAHLCPDAAQDALAEIDAALHTYASQSPWHGSFDLIGGLVGLGVYFLERLPANAARAGLSEILTRLDELAVTSEQGITWHTPAELVPPQQREQASDGYCNCGMAHGVPGVIAFLARCVVARGGWQLLRKTAEWCRPMAAGRAASRRVRFRLPLLGGRKC